MGDRATFVFEQSNGFEENNGDAIFLYGHWAGEGMMANLATAIEKASPRWSDESYATRIAISQIIGNQWDQELSWGISTYFGDSEHSVPVVNWTNQTVRLLPHSWDKKFDLNADPKFVMSFESFINKFAKSLTTV